MVFKHEITVVVVVGIESIMTYFSSIEYLLIAGVGQSCIPLSKGHVFESRQQFQQEKL